MLDFKHSYWDLPKSLFSKAEVLSLTGGSCLLFNEDLYAEMGGASLSQDDKVKWSSGSIFSSLQNPIGQAYAGHQFGHFTMLGDGRAALIGEVGDGSSLVDVSLKGSGPTNYSRRGDGLATLKSCIREYIMSECMHHLGIPTSRSLCVGYSREAVYREEIFERGLLTRVAKSHIRIGTFQYLRQYHPDDLKAMLKYVRQRHFPEIVDDENLAINLLEAYGKNLINTVVQWYRIGFIHGVMNTDNMALSGETIDYGPCSFMNAYDPETVYSSIDRLGRYAFGKQRDIALWNLIRFAESLLPLMGEDPEKSVKKANEVIERLVLHFDAEWMSMMLRKIGFSQRNERKEKLVYDLLNILKKDSLDYNNAFLYLTDLIAGNESFFDSDFKHNEMIKKWVVQWFVELGEERERSVKLMSAENPQIIPRNHVVEKLIDDAVENKDGQAIESFIELIAQGTSISNLGEEEQKWFGRSPFGYDVNFRTYCGT